MKSERSIRSNAQLATVADGTHALDVGAGMARITDAFKKASQPQDAEKQVVAILNAAKACRVELISLVQQYVITLEGRDFVSDLEQRKLVQDLRIMLQATGSRLQCPCCAQPTLPALSGFRSRRKFHFDHAGAPQQKCLGTELSSRFGKGFDKLPAMIVVPAPARRGLKPVVARPT